MKKLLLLALAAITLSLSAYAQDEKYPDGFLDKSLTISCPKPVSLS